MIQRIFVEMWVWWEWLWAFVPGRSGMLIRKLTIAPFLSYSGNKLKSLWMVRIPEFVHFWKPWNVVVGHDVRFGKYSQINAEGKIIIGSNVMMGPYIMLTTVTHGYRDRGLPMMKQKETVDSIAIEDDVWIGGHVSIMPGATVERGIVIGAGAVVTKSLEEPFGIYVGVPATFKKLR